MSEAPRLTSLGEVRALLRRHGLTPDKGFGQNFLVDASVLRAIVDAAALRPDDTVLEIGPGLGVLTAALAPRVARVVSVELDARLLPALQETLAAAPSVELVQGDGLAFDYGRLPSGSALVANLPYQVATPLLARALESGRFSRIVVLVQREVAERLRATAGTSAYGALSLLVAHFARARIVRHVPPGAFLPPPKVSSSVVHLEVRPGVTPDPDLFALVHACFAHRRKTLLNNLLRAGVTPERARPALDAVGLDPRVRAEALDLDAFRGLRSALHHGDAPGRAAGGILRQATTESEPPR